MSRRFVSIDCKVIRETAGAVFFVLPESCTERRVPMSHVSDVIKRDEQGKLDTIRVTYVIAVRYGLIEED